MAYKYMLLQNLAEQSLGIDIYADSLKDTELYVSTDKLKELLEHAYIL